jgi:hypothetical protein
VSRTLSAPALAALNAPQTDKVFLALLTITHANLAQPVRVVNDMVNVTSRGNEYIGLPFQIDLPSEVEEELPRVRLTIDNVDRLLVEAVRTLTSPPTITLEVILASSPDTVEAGPLPFALRNAEYDSLVVTGELAFEDVLNEGFPAHSFTPNLFAGIF